MEVWSGSGFMWTLPRFTCCHPAHPFLLELLCLFHQLPVPCSQMCNTVLFAAIVGDSSCLCPASLCAPSRLGAPWGPSPTKEHSAAAS